MSYNRQSGGQKARQNVVAAYVQGQQRPGIPGHKVGSGKNPCAGMLRVVLNRPGTRRKVPYVAYARTASQ